MPISTACLTGSDAVVKFSSDREKSRREASEWFARMRGPASEDDRAAFERWYAADPAHAEAFDRIKGSFEAAGLIAQSDIGRSRSLPGRAQRSSWTRPYAMAAGLAALLVVSGAALLGRPEGLMPAAEAEVLFFATRVGEIREVPLADGSKLTLDTRTAVRVEMSREVRHVTLREGRMRVAVARQDKRPFVVDSGEIRVTSHDATFDVALDSGAASVQPLHGAVSVEPAREGSAAVPVRLAPGQVISVAASGGGIEPREASRSESMWPNGMLEFDNTPLESVVAEANRYSRARISLAHPSLSLLRVSGTFRAGDIEGLARSLEAAFGLRLERSGPGEFLLHPAPSSDTARDRQKKGG